MRYGTDASKFVMEALFVLLFAWGRAERRPVVRTRQPRTSPFLGAESAFNPCHLELNGLGLEPRWSQELVRESLGVSIRLEQTAVQV